MIVQSAQRQWQEKEDFGPLPGVTSRSAEDWFVEPGARTVETLPDPLAIDPNDLTPLPTDDAAVSPLSLLLGAANDGELSWQDQALCAQTDPEAFFPEKGGSTREAKRVCASCEVRSECLEYALANDERFGIWGGMSERERRRLKKRAV
ncbi:transcription factor WhiB [Brevibacterium sanguinis]|uniref:Transcriptional regulator WhiB n=2 Tax=Brevibacterium TaxID=1696 RepID=A0A366IKP1_9MICO|nr:transcription factor WhiB [Brevibacterium sanguinis]RBP72788.1 transcription factor WhiB [Brevibacterium celere]